VITQTCTAGTTDEGTVCVSATNGCNVRSEERHVPYCILSAATVMTVTAECVCVLLIAQSNFLCAVDAIKPYVI